MKSDILAGSIAGPSRGRSSLKSAPGSIAWRSNTAPRCGQRPQKRQGRGRCAGGRAGRGSARPTGGHASPPRSPAPSSGASTGRRAFRAEGPAEQAAVPQRGAARLIRGVAAHPRRRAYFFMQMPTMPVAPVQLALPPCSVAAPPPLHRADTSTSSALQDASRRSHRSRAGWRRRPPPRRDRPLRSPRSPLGPCGPAGPVAPRSPVAPAGRRRLAAVTLGTLRPGGTCFTLRTSGSGRPCLAARALHAGRPGLSGGPGIALGALRPRRTARAGRALLSLLAGGALRSFAAGEQQNSREGNERAEERIGDPPKLDLVQLKPRPG